MRRAENLRFYCQTIQETVALHTLLPIRTLSLENLSELFSECRLERFAGLDYTNQETFVADLKRQLKKIPSFFNESAALEIKTFDDIKEAQIRRRRDRIYFTKSSFNPFFMAALDRSPPIRVYKMFFYLYLLFASRSHRDNTVYDACFFGFAYRYFCLDERLYLIGPVMTDPRFKEDAMRLRFVKQIKYRFALQLHTYELLNMLHQRNVHDAQVLTKEVKRIRKIFQIARESYIDKAYRKHDLRDFAASLIAASGRKKRVQPMGCVQKDAAFYRVRSGIRNNQILRDLEALEWFNDLIFQNLSFETAGESERMKETVFKYLETKLQADGYVACRYDHYTQRLSLLEISSKLPEPFRAGVVKTIEALNRDPKRLMQTYTYDVIRDYNEHKNPIRLVEEIAQEGFAFCYNKRVASVLSIPLVFDKRVFAVLHFISFQKYRFDEIDKRFLLKLSSALSKRYIENNLNRCIDQTVGVLEGLHKRIDHPYLKHKTDEVCENIANAFACDGVIIWFNKKEVFQRPGEVSALSVLSEINFFDKWDRESGASYVIGSEEEDSLIFKNAHKDVVVIGDIVTQCTDNRKDRFFMKYKEAFVRKGITSIMFVAIKNYEGVLSGAVMVFDKAPRNYSQLSRRMLKRISVYIGSILNTVTYAKYRSQRIDESILHESSQYLNIIKSRALDLERRIQRQHLPDSYDKYTLFLNIEDIKDFTNYTRSYLFSIFKNGDLSIRRYDELLVRSIEAIRQNNAYTSLKKSVNQVLVVHGSRMYESKQMRYKNRLEEDVEIRIPSQYLHDVLGNLINNAIKYGKSGSYIKIWDRYVRFHYYTIYIENIGYRIRKEERERIFQKGVRGYVVNSLLKEEEAFRQTLAANRGLGLYMAKGLIKNGLGGNVVLHDTVPIQGTQYARHTFAVKIPVEMVRKVR